MPSKKPIWQQPNSFFFVCLVYSLALKMEVTCSSKTSVDFQLTTRRYVPEDRNSHNHRYDNLESYSMGEQENKFTWRDCTKLRIISVRIADVPGEI
jgi:hypothetical protein